LESSTYLVWNLLVILYNFAIRRIISLWCIDGMLDLGPLTPKAPWILWNVLAIKTDSPPDKKSGSYAVARARKRENRLHPSCGPIAGLAALISRFIVQPFATSEK